MSSVDDAVLFEFNLHTHLSLNHFFFFFFLARFFALSPIIFNIPRHPPLALHTVPPRITCVCVPFSVLSCVLLDCIVYR